MSVNIIPIFKGALIVRALIAVYLIFASLFFVFTPSSTSHCKYNYQDADGNWIQRPWLANRGELDVFAFTLIISSIVIVFISYKGFQNESANYLRHLKLAIVIETVICFSAIMFMQYGISFFMGMRYGRWEATGCTTLSDTVPVLFTGWISLFVYNLPFSIILEAYLKSIGEELSFFDYILAWVNHIRNCIKYGRQGISFTSSFVRSQVKSRLSKSVRVSQKNDTLFREVEIGSRMFGAISLELLKENIAHKYDRHPNDIIRLTKNGNVLIVDDSDVMRLTNEDFIEVEFENQGQKLQEINSIILEDSISETRIEM